MTTKRLEELTGAKERLRALLDAVVAVRMDATAEGLLAEMMQSTRDGTGTDTGDLEQMCVLALAHAYAHYAVEEQHREPAPVLRLVAR